MIETEQRLQRASELMATSDQHRVPEVERKGALAQAAERGLDLTGEQRAAFYRVTGGCDLEVAVGYHGTGKRAMLGVARAAWDEAGFRVHGAALAGSAPAGLANGTGT